MDWWNGQDRRAWLDAQDAKIRNALSYYLGPAAEPVNALAQVGGALSPGADMMDMVTASRGLMQSDSAPNALTNAGWLAAATLGMALPGSVSGYRNAAEAATAKADEVLDLLRTGRASEVTDDMLAAADPARLYSGYDLPMDEASRMARAREMGFATDTPLYHGSDKEFMAFDPSKQRDPGFWFTSAANTAANYVKGGEGSFHKVYTRNAPETRIMFGEDDYGKMVPMSESGEILDDRDNVDLVSGAFRGGADKVIFPVGNFSEDDYTEVIRNPQDIRLTIARFDPRLAHLRNLLAGGAGLGVGLNALSGPPPEDRY